MGGDAGPPPHDHAPAGLGLPNGPDGRFVFGIEVPALGTLGVFGP